MKVIEIRLKDLIVYGLVFVFALFCIIQFIQIKADMKEMKKNVGDNSRKINYAYAYFAGVSACFVFLVAYLKSKLFGG